MQMVRGITTAVVLALFLCIGLSFLPIQSLQMDAILERHSVATAVDPVKRVMEACQTLPIHGRVEQVVRREQGVQLVISSDQELMNDLVYNDVYNLAYRIVTSSPVKTVSFDIEHQGISVGNIEVKQSDFISPLPKKDEITNYVLEHFQVKLP